MCLYPKKIVNPSKVIRPGSGQPLYITVPCGHCSECLRSRRNEWRVRSQFEASNADFCLFDTLTYSFEHLPHLSDLLSVPKYLDFPCFYKKHLQDFLKRLRSNLSYAGYSVEDNLRYFIACEYGTDPSRTKRPHYHVLFFSNVPFLSPFVLSVFISKSWPHGRTDGIPFQSRSYVKKNRVFSGNLSLLPVISYVTKYCTKQFDYEDLVKDRLSKLKNNIDYDLFKLAKQFVRPFHIQSKSFGWKYIGRSPDSFIDFPFLHSFSELHIGKKYALPKSLERKMFYFHFRSGDRVVFVPTSLLVQYKQRVAFRNISFLAHRLAAGDPAFFDLKKAEMILYAQDRLLDNYTSYFDVIKSSYNFGSGLFNYCCHDSKVFRKFPFFSKINLGNKVDGYLSVPFSDSDLIPLDKLPFFFDSSLSSFIKRLFSRKDDPALEVEKLLCHLKNKFKSYAI